MGCAELPDFKDKVEFEDVTAIAESELALQVVIAGLRIWMPKSQIDDDSEVWKNGQQGTLVVSEWIAREKRLI